MCYFEAYRVCTQLSNISQGSSESFAVEVKPLCPFLSGKSSARHISILQTWHKMTILVPCALLGCFLFVFVAQIHDGLFHCRILKHQSNKSRIDKPFPDFPTTQVNSVQFQQTELFLKMNSLNFLSYLFLTNGKLFELKV